jgi:hypothetical protein
VTLFSNSDGTCNDLARAAVRLGFHDAGAWSTTSGGGGADGSIVLSSDEINRSENNGLQAIRSQALAILSQYSSFNVGAADLVRVERNPNSYFTFFHDILSGQLLLRKYFMSSSC